MTGDPYDRLAAALRDLVNDAVARAVAGLAVGGLQESISMVSVSDAARQLGLGSTKTKELLAAGELRSVVIGRRRLVTQSAIADYRHALERRASASA